MTVEIPISPKLIEQKIYFVRGEKVMLDSSLADLYQIETKYIIRAVKRNTQRFPIDFAFQLTAEEVEILRCHFGTSSEGHGGRRYLPWVFTEHGILMLSSVLKSERAALVNVQIMRSFVHLRKLVSSHEGLLKKLNELEQRHDQNFKVVFKALNDLINPTVPSSKRPIGFGRDKT
jgi:hypothetical protein